MNGPQYCPLPVTRSSTSSGRPACSTSHRPCPAITVRPASRHGGWLSSDTSARKSAVRRQGQLGGAGTAADGSVPVFVASETSKVRWPSSWAPSGRVFGGSITASCRPGFPAHLTPSITLASQPIQSGRCPNLADRPGRQSITRKSLCSWPVLVQKDPRRSRGPVPEHPCEPARADLLSGCRRRNKGHRTLGSVGTRRPAAASRLPALGTASAAAQRRAAC
jgi:hypothetical protein